MCQGGKYSGMQIIPMMVSIKILNIYQCNARNITHPETQYKDDPKVRKVYFYDPGKMPLLRYFFAIKIKNGVMPLLM